MIKNSVCCVIVTYNIGERFYSCYNAIAKQVEKVIIVDNGSNQETISIIKKLSENQNTISIFNKENLGIASALNIGIKRALDEGFQWILTMDNDSIATNDMIKDMLEHYSNFNKEDKVVGIFPTYIDL